MNFTHDARLAFYLPSLRGGGAERVTVNLMRGLAKMDVPLDLVLVKAEGPYLAEVPDNVRVIDLQSTRVIASVPHLIRYLKRERPAVLVSAMVQANIAALLARRLVGGNTKLAVVEHSTLSRQSLKSTSRKEILMPIFARRVYPWAKGVAAVSQGVADDLAQVTGVSREKIKVLYNPVVREEIFEAARQDIQHPWFHDSNSPLIIAIGRLTKPKDFPTLIRAFASLKKQRDAKLLILGEGEERQSLEALVKELGLETCVSLPGFVTNPYAYLARARLFVLSSQWEGLPTVLIEALALGVPAVSTDCESGPREILKHGNYGRLSPVGDSSALAKQIEAALDEIPKKIPREAWSEFCEDVAATNYLQFVRAL